MKVSAGSTCEKREENFERDSNGRVAARDDGGSSRDERVTGFGSNEGLQCKQRKTENSLDASRRRKKRVSTEEKRVSGGLRRGVNVCAHCKVQGEREQEIEGEWDLPLKQG